MAVYINAKFDVLGNHMATLIVALRVAISSTIISRTFNELHNLCEGEGS